MEFTKYGKAMAKQEPHMPNPDNLSGASLHAKACAYDVGINVLLTGKDSRGKRFTRTANSVYGAYATMQAMWGINNAWHIREDGTRKLLVGR